ncbi:MAG: AgmX/PglI C-terminal domain-containing protein [Nannocystaceae bacterium]
MPSVEAGEGLDGAIISRILQAHRNGIRRCYHQSLARDPSARVVTVEFTLDPEGTVKTVRPARRQLGDPELGDCIGKAIGRWRFPRSSEGGTVTVTVPLASTAQ